MRYGSLNKALCYVKIEDWVQDFLRNDGDNVALADGLLKEKRNYIGPVQFELSKIDVEIGAPSYLTKSNVSLYPAMDLWYIEVRLDIF